MANKWKDAREIYITPRMEIVRFGDEDVIVTSLIDTGDDIWPEYSEDNPWPGM